MNTIYKFIFVFYLCAFSSAFGLDGMFLKERLSKVPNPFNYALNLTVTPSQDKQAGVILCFHGTGADHETGAVIAQAAPHFNVVSFDFPDAKIYVTGKRYQDSTFGSIEEILPALYVAKACLRYGNVDALSLYGFSSGGGAVINFLAVLNGSKYDNWLAVVGIGKEDKEAILSAVQKGYVILDCSVKSHEEIICFRGNLPELVWKAKKYAMNGFTPINALDNLQGLSLNVLVNFQNPDEAVFNRDDDLFAKRLRQVNDNGRTTVVISHDEGHIAYHSALWKAFEQLQAERR